MPDDDDEKPRRGKYRRSDPSTSVEGAEIDVSKLELLILAALLEGFRSGGATTNELAEYLNYPHNSVAPRMVDLEERGLVNRHFLRYYKNHPQYLSRTGPYGKPRQIWWHKDCYPHKEKQK